MKIIWFSALLDSGVNPDAESSLRLAMTLSQSFPTGIVSELSCALFGGLELIAIELILLV
jgi:hypothetical protein